MRLSEDVLDEGRCIYVDKWYSSAYSIACSPQYNAMCMQWKDKRDDCMLSSCIPDENISLKQRGKELKVLSVINTYNNMIDCVDLSDQMMNSYPVEHKRLKK